MTVREFVERVNDPDAMRPNMPFVAAWVVPYKSAFRQFVMEVLMLQTMTAEEWMADKVRRQHGWPQAIEAAFEAYQQEIRHE